MLLQLVWEPRHHIERAVLPLNIANSKIKTGENLTNFIQRKEFYPERSQTKLCLLNVTLLTLAGAKEGFLPEKK